VKTRLPDGGTQAEILDGFYDFLRKLSLLQPPPQLSVARFLLEKGQAFTPQKLPKGIEKGQAKLCYANASMMVAADSSLCYAEGYVLSPRTGYFPIEHAWAVDQDGRVIDNTLPSPEANAYYGVSFEAGELMAWLRQSEVYGVFGGRKQWVERVLVGESLTSACHEQGEPEL
jgi:hypothetical protein